jgi:phage recombination protein Bet
MSDALALVPASVDVSTFFSRQQVELIKRQVADGSTDDELQLFLYQCARTGLDPFSRQIYFIVREQWDPKKRAKVPKATIQTGIDGLRLIAERTRRYAPGPEPVYEYDAGGRVRKATSYVLKRTDDGTWHTVAASAYYDEYVALKQDGTPQGMWGKPHIMLGKCAEALALRRAFPAELSGLYTAEEMAQADHPTAAEYTPPPPKSAPKTGPAPVPNTPPPAEVDERGLRINRLCLLKAPDGLGWTKVGAKGWLRKRFGTESTGSLTEQQKRDAETLLVARLTSEQSYQEHVKLFAEQGRCQAAPPPAREPGADDDGVIDDGDVPA